jgi:drug/metabolite transporter (DMT)-like permease
MKGIFYALAAAALFGVSTPLAKLLLEDLHPLTLAGLLYASSGVGLAIILLFRQLTRTSSHPIAWPARKEWPAFATAIVLGGVVAPVLLMFGLQHTAASVSSLLLNLESVFTALLAWFVFRENFDRRIALGMTCVVIGGLVLSWAPGQHGPFAYGAAMIAGACLCWAADNNLTRKVATSDAVAIACIKGLVAGAINLFLAWTLQLHLPALSLEVFGAMLVGVLGFGVSLSLFLVALRHLGAARTSAYFSAGPFIGVTFAIVVQHEPITAQLLVAAALIVCGLWLHWSEHHEHQHTHEPLDHTHSHTHDLHHQHSHDIAWDGMEPHTHAHRHSLISHQHPHYPDSHHQHAHRA